MCGKYLPSSTFIGSLVGSPPRVWEVLKDFLERTKNKRITPTCVGSTAKWGARTSRTKDHPHVCGKYVSLLTHQDLNAGSPPRVWEVRPVPPAVPVRPGITPTCVGSTVLGYELLGREEDHPHVCGKYGLISLVNNFKLGSPPRVWEVH